VSALEAVAIAGAAESDLGHVPHLSPLGLMAQATVRAAADAGISVGEIDGVFAVTPYHHLSSLSFCEYVGLRPRYHETTNIGGCSFLAHVRHAAGAIASGLCETAVITYGSTQRSDGGRLVTRSEVSSYEQPYGPIYPMSQFALIAQRHMYEYGTTSEQLAEVAVAHRSWAGLAPNAYKRDPITVDDVFASPLISSPFHRLDCCLVTDGGAAVILTTRERAKTLRQTPVHVLGAAEGFTHRNIASMENLTVSAAAVTGPAAFAEAGLGPSDMDFVQLYDAFTITPVMILEDLGFCAKGEGGSFVSGGRTAPGGELPVNTNGGGLSYCHPGMLSLFLLVEGIRQLRHECGERQVAGAEVGIVHGLGGTFASAATVVVARSD
jgi:acetyl-CoA acetyltransferase